MALLVREDLEWSDDEAESREYQRLARDWNAIHRALLAQPEPSKTTPVDHGFFFIFEDELLFCSGYAFGDSTKEPNWDLSCPLYNFDGQGAEDLADLAEKMEAWLENPTFAPLPAGLDRNPDIPRSNDADRKRMKFYLVEV